MRKKHIYVIIYMFLSHLFFAQNDSVSITGKVFANGFPDPIKKAAIHLKLSNGGMFECFSNDSGSYSFKIKTFPGKGELTIATDKNTAFVTKKNNTFLASKDKAELDFSQAKHFIKDFFLSKAPVCGLNGMPHILFSANTTQMIASKDSYSDSLMSPDKIIDFYYELMFNNTEIVMELRGRCDTGEKNVKELSLKRAALVADLLIKKGIDKVRLSLVGAGIPAQRTNANTVNLSEADKKELHQYNKSVNMRIISWDYADPKAPKKKTATGNEENSQFIED